MQTGKMKLTNFAGAAQPEDEAGQVRILEATCSSKKGEWKGGGVPSIYV